MSLKIPRIPALGALLAVAALGVAGCGDAIPGNAVVRVDDDLIERSEFNHWLQIAAAGTQQPGRTGKPAIPDPPEFRNCVATKQKTAPKPAKGQPKPTAAQFKQQCEQEYEGLRDQTLAFLIAAKWVAGEAADQGVSISNQEVEKRFQETKKQSFPKEADFQKFLKDSGMTLEDIKFRVRVEQLQQKLVEKITKGKDKVTDAQIRKYYDENEKRFAQPERRDLRIVLTKEKSRADAAKRELEGGKSFKDVAKEYSIDQASKAQGGQLLAVTKGQQEKAFDDAIFKAPKGELQGPVKTQFGFYVFKVQKITPASQQKLEQARETIKQLLSSQNQQKALDTFIKEYRSKWKDRTNCREGFVTQDCKNAPKPKTNTTAVPGQPQQGQPAPQQVPEQGGQPAPQQVPEQGGAGGAQPAPAPEG